VTAAWGRASAWRPDAGVRRLLRCDRLPICRSQPNTRSTSITAFRHHPSTFEDDAAFVRDLEAVCSCLVVSTGQSCAGRGRRYGAAST
jgi:hypothetical protein